MIMNYSNAVVTAKENAVVDESIFSAPLYAKLMLKKGMTFDDAIASPSLENFIVSEKGLHIRCEAFSVSTVTGAIVSHESSLWCNLSVDSKILVNKTSKMFFAELIPYQFKLEDAEEISLF